MVHSHLYALPYHFKLLKGVSIASALVTLSIMAPGIKAQSLTAIQQTNISGSAEFGLVTGESFNVSAQAIQQADATSGAVNFKPFETTVGSSIALGGLRVQGADPVAVGNAGQSSLTLTYDRSGFLPIQEDDPNSSDPTVTRNVSGDGSITAVGGITPLGGDRLSGGLTNTNVPSNIRLNQDLETGLPGIEFTEFVATTEGSSTTQNGASITTTLTGAKSLQASVITQTNLINSITVFGN